jgi:hypothetical protein
MLNKDKRSMALMLILGDGNLHKNKKGYASMNIDHGIVQSDYQSWKAKLLTDVFEKNIKVRVGHKGKSIQVQFTNNVFRAWYKFTYPNNKKDIARILPFIRHPELALAIWLMDDGYCEPSFSKLADGSKKNYGARFRIFTCDQSNETQQYIINWIKTNFNVDCKVHFTTRKKDNKTYPFLKFNQKDSLIIWEKLREFILQFKSMQYKFRYIEQIYQFKMSQCIPNS